MLTRGLIYKMSTRLSLGTLLPATAGRAGLSAVNVRPCCSLNKSIISSEDPSGKPYINILSAGRHNFNGDLGELFGAGGTAPDPKDYAYAALALCTSMTVRMYADKKKWPLKHIEVEIQEIDQAMERKVPDGLQAILKLGGDLTEAQKEDLIRVSQNCTVSQILSGKIKNGITPQISEAAPPSKDKEGPLVGAEPLIS